MRRRPQAGEVAWRNEIVLSWLSVLSRTNRHLPKMINESTTARVPLALALLVAVAFPAAFFVSAPSLRTTLGAVWLVGAGIIMGWITYNDRRAAPYLSDRPSVWTIGRKLARLDRSRYAEGGRTFVHREILGVVALAIWWIGVGPLLLFR